MTTPLIGSLTIGSLVDAYVLKKVVLVNTTARKKDKINTLLTKIKTIEKISKRFNIYY